MNDKDGYRIWVPSKHRVLKSRNVDFHPEKLCTTNNTIEFKLQNLSEENNDYKEENQGVLDNHIPEEKGVFLEDGNARLDNVRESSDIPDEALNVCPVRKVQQPARFDDY